MDKKIIGIGFGAIGAGLLIHTLIKKEDESAPEAELKDEVWASSLAVKDALAAAGVTTSLSPDDLKTGAPSGWPSRPSDEQIKSIALPEDWSAAVEVLKTLYPNAQDSKGRLLVDRLEEKLQDAMSDYWITGLTPETTTSYRLAGAFGNTLSSFASAQKAGFVGTFDDFYNSKSVLRTDITRVLKDGEIITIPGSKVRDSVGNWYIYPNGWGGTSRIATEQEAEEYERIRLGVQNIGQNEYTNWIDHVESVNQAEAMLLEYQERLAKIETGEFTHPDMTQEEYYQHTLDTNIYTWNNNLVKRLAETNIAREKAIDVLAEQRGKAAFYDNYQLILQGNGEYLIKGTGELNGDVVSAKQVRAIWSGMGCDLVLDLPTTEQLEIMPEMTETIRVPTLEEIDEGIVQKTWTAKSKELDGLTEVVDRHDRRYRGKVDAAYNTTREEANDKEVEEDRDYGVTWTSSGGYEAKAIEDMSPAEYWGLPD